MIRTHPNIESLLDSINKDKQDRSPAAVRYPVRFVFFNTFDLLRRFVHHLSDIPLIQLKSQMPHQDGWLTSEDLYRIVASQETDSLIVPMSEVLRFFQDGAFQSLLLSLFEIENAREQASRRIYLPFVGLKGRCENNVFKTFHRRAHWAPIWSVEEEYTEKIRIYQLVAYTGVEVDIAPAGFTIIRTTSDWLDLWKHAPLQAVVCKSRSMAYLYKDFLPDAIFQPEQIDTPKAYLEKILGVALPMPYQTQEARFWDALLHKESKHRHEAGFVDFHHVVATHFNIRNVRAMTPEGLFTLWFQYPDAFSRWLLRHWVLNQPYLQIGYLYKTMSAIVRYTDDELITHLWFDIFEFTPSNAEIFTERKTYLKLLHEEYKLPCHPLEEKLRRKLSELVEKPLELQAQYLTNISYAERTYLFDLLQTMGADQQERYDELLRQVYPELFHYLHWQVMLDNPTLEDWLPAYFQEYARSKVFDCKTETLTVLLNEKNHDQNSFYAWYYKLGKHREDDEQACLIWIDGLGAEWLSLLIYLINSYGQTKNKHVAKAYLSTANLPTTTEHNRFEQAIYIRDFDTYIHRESPYIYPDDLIRQIELLQAIVKRDIIENPHERIIVVSDHGCTFLAQKRFGNFKKYDFQASDHEGRCLWIEQEYQADSDFLVHTIQHGAHEGQKTLVALKHTSLYTTPAREVHVGATPEEVVTPYLVISKIDDRITYHITLITSEISVRRPLLLVDVAPLPPLAPVLIWKGKEFRFELQDDHWGVLLHGFKAGEYQFELQVLDQKFDLPLTMTGGFKERDLL